MHPTASWYLPGGGLRLVEVGFVFCHTMKTGDAAGDGYPSRKSLVTPIVFRGSRMSSMAARFVLMH